MKKIEIATLSFKVLSIYAIIQAISRLPDIFYYLFKNDNEELMILNLAIVSVPLLLLVISSVLLWFTAPLLATSIFKSIVSEDRSEVSLVNIQIIAFSIVGLYILASSFPELVNIAIVIITAASIEGGRGSMIHIVVVFILKIMLGLWLLLGSHGIVKFLSSLRRE